MPIITSSGQKIYGRHEQVPRPPTKKRGGDDKTETDNTTTATTKSTLSKDSATTDLWAMAKEIIALLVVIGLVTWSIHIRKDGMITVAGSVMSKHEAAVYSSQIEFSHAETSLSPLPEIQNKIPPPQQSEETTTKIVNNDIEGTIPETTEEVWAQGPCGDIGNQVFVSSKVSAQYKIKATKAQQQESSKTITEAQFITVETEKPVEFIVKTLEEAVQTGSTLPLLHYLAPNMCKGQTKTVNFTKELYTEITSDQHTTFNPTQTDFLLTLFPTLSQGSRQEKTTTITFPIEFAIELIDVVSKDSMKLKAQHDEKILLQNGDITAFFRAILGSVHPIVLLIAYVGMRFGGAYYKRYKIRSLRRKKLEEAKAKGASEEEQNDIKTENITYDDVVSDEVDQAVEEIIKNDDREQKIKQE